MRNINLLLISCLTAILLLFAACDKFCMEKRPKDVKPIDWENYNSVHTVFWNYHSTCENVKHENKEIMAFGWIYSNGDGFFVLTDVTNYTPYEIPHVIIRPDYKVSNGNEFYAKLATCDLTKKCFIKEKLMLCCTETMLACSKSTPAIVFSNIDDVYFE